uniref:Uncharacterized protein n=1 Tax=Strongyloides stercoralis TaxID=6248 RepID=A0AAF5HXZ9_STRER
MPPRTIRYRPKSQPPLHYYFDEMSNATKSNYSNHPQSTNFNQKNLRTIPNLDYIYSTNNNNQFFANNQNSSCTNTSTNSTSPSLSPSDRSFFESQNIMDKVYYHDNSNEKGAMKSNHIRVNNNYSPDLIPFVVSFNF